ncbi:MAG: hypothetical protein OCD76_12090 [Reichenbachiella sp.]
MFIFEYSAWLIVVAMALAGGLTYLLYTKNSPWSTLVNYILAAVRFSLITLLLILLLNPLLQQFQTTVEKPKIIIALDDSASMINVMDSSEIAKLKASISELSSTILGADMEVELVGMSSDLDLKDVSDLRFDHKTSDITSWIKRLESKYENQNVGAIYLISDGNANVGASLDYSSFENVLNTIGVGDTTQKRDIELKDIHYNKIVYQGNNYPIACEISQFGFDNEMVVVSVFDAGKLVATKSLRLKGKLSQLEFELNAHTEGLQKLRVVVQPAKGEIIEENNKRLIYFDVIDGKQKIAIISPAPHPDIRMLNQVLSKNINYEVSTVITGVGKLEGVKYDLAIVHSPKDRYNRTQKEVDRLINAGVPILYIVGAKSIVQKFSAVHPDFDVRQNRYQRDEVQGVYNSQFELFDLPDVTNERLEQIIPLSVPYGEVVIGEQASVLLYQKVGSVVTDKPLLYVVEDSDSKAGFFLADGLWQWRQQEHAIFGDTHVTDEMISNLVKYLSAKSDKRKFRFYPSANEYTTEDKVTFEAELYNNIFERVYDKNVDVKIIRLGGDVKEYSFVPSSSYAQLELSALEEGVYQYEARTDYSGEVKLVKGSFVIKDIQLEQQDQNADYVVLQLLANNNQGSFYTGDQIQAVKDDLVKTDYKSRLFQEEQILSIIHLDWIFYILLAIVSIEWFTRKYSGGY